MQIFCGNAIELGLTGQAGLRRKYNGAKISTEASGFIEAVAEYSLVDTR